MNNWLIYLVEVSICQALFCVLYLGLFRNLSFFQVNRLYLLSATVLSFIIPVLSIPIWNSPTIDTSLSLSQRLQSLELTFKPYINNPVQETSLDINWLITILGLIYLIGFFYHFWKLFRGITMVLKLTQNNEVIEDNGYKAIHLNNGPSFFSFLNYIFINTGKLNISGDEFSQVIEHEKTHAKQRHTIDNLLMELAILICWFNPVLKIMKRELNNVHEFYADAKASDLKGNIENYSRLLLKLASNKEGSFLTHQFSMNTIKKRIIMLNKTKYRRSIALRYFLIAPCLILLLAVFSFVQKNHDKPGIIFTQTSSQVIGKVSWEGNTLYSDEYLSKHLGLKKGDLFDEKTINEKLNYQAEGGDLGSLFMDQGYLFFTVELKKEIKEREVDLTFDIHEGDIITINKVIITGNNKISNAAVLKMIDIKEGELFSRSKLISSQKKIVASGFFNPENININPIPHLSDGNVDIEFKVVEL